MTFKTVASTSKTILDVTDAYTVSLSQETYTVACDKDGNAITGELGSTGKAKSTISVYKGATPLNGVASNPSLNQFSYTIGTQTGCTADRIDNTTFYLKTVSADSGTIQISINIEGDVTVTKVFDFSKSKIGQTGNNGKTYVLNITGGIRSIAYDASGGNPNPSTSTAFSVTLYEDGTLVTPTSYTWSVGGNITGSGSGSTFTPTIATVYASGNTYVTVSVTYGGNTITQTVPIASTKDATGVNWVNDWTQDGLTTINGQRVISPHIFAGQMNGDSTITGVAIGKDVMSGATGTNIGIVSYQNNNAVFQVKTDGSVKIGMAGKDQITLDANGNAVLPNIQSNKIIVGATGQDIYNYTNSLAQVKTINSGRDILCHYDDNLTATNGVYPSAYQVTMRPSEGRFGGAVAIEDTTTNLVLGVTKVDESSSSITYSGTWTSESGTTTVFDGGTAKYSSTNGDYAVLPFTGTGIRMYVPTYTNRCIANVTIDNGTPTNVDMYSATVTYKVKVFEVTNLPYGNHTLKVQVTNNKNTSSTGYVCELDYFEVLDNTIGTFENGNNWIKTGTVTTSVTEVASPFNGKNALKVTSVISGSGYYIKPVLSASTTYTLSLWVNVVSGIDSTHKIAFGVADPSWITGGVINLGALTNGWQRQTITFTMPATITSPYLYIGYANGSDLASCEVYVDNIQLEQKGFATSYINGTRSAGRLEYPRNIDIRGNWSVCFWSNIQGLTSNNPVLFTWGWGIHLNLYNGTLGNYCFALYDGTNPQVKYTSTTSATLNGYDFIVWTKSGNTYTLYVNGIAVITKSDSTTLTYSNYSSFSVGGYYNNNYSNALIDELYITTDILSASDVMAIYNLQQPLFDSVPIINPPSPTSVSISFI